MRQWHFAIFFQVSGWQLFWHVGHQKRCFPGYSPLTPINLYVYHVYLVSIIIWTYFDITWYFDKYPFIPSCFPSFMAVDPWGQTSPSLSDSTTAVVCTLRFLTAGPGFFVEAPGHTHSHEVTETRQANLSGRKRWWNKLVKKLTHFVPDNCKGVPCFFCFFLGQFAGKTRVLKFCREQQLNKKSKMEWFCGGDF